MKKELFLLIFILGCTGSPPSDSFVSDVKSQVNEQRARVNDTYELSVDCDALCFELEIIAEDYDDCDDLLFTFEAEDYLEACDTPCEVILSDGVECVIE